MCSSWMETNRLITRWHKFAWDIGATIDPEFDELEINAGPTVFGPAQRWVTVPPKLCKIRRPKGDWFRCDIKCKWCLPYNGHHTQDYWHVDMKPEEYCW